LEALLEDTILSGVATPGRYAVTAARVTAPDDFHKYGRGSCRNGEFDVVFWSFFTLGYGQNRVFNNGAVAPPKALRLQAFPPSWQRRNQPACFRKSRRPV